MSLTVTCSRSIEAVNGNQWNNVVEQSDLGSVFHRYEWLRAVENGTPLEPRHLLVSKKNNPIAVFPIFVIDVEPTPFRRLNSIRPGFGGPICATEEETCMKLFFEGIPQLCTGRIRFIQLSHLHPRYVRYHDTFEEHGYDLRVGQCGFALDISRDWADVLDEMDGSRRRAIREGNEQNFEVVDEELTHRTLAALHEGSSSVMERVGATPWPRSFVLALAQLPDRVKVFSLYVDGERRGMLQFVVDEEQSTIHYMISAVTNDHFAYHASELIHEHAIRWGIENGFEQYDFGPTDPKFDDGLFRFKAQFGAKAYPLLSWERGYPAPMLSALNAGRFLTEKITS